MARGKTLIIGLLFALGSALAACVAEPAPPYGYRFYDPYAYYGYAPDYYYPGYYGAPAYGSFGYFYGGPRHAIAGRPRPAACAGRRAREPLP